MNDDEMIDDGGNTPGAIEDQIAWLTEAVKRREAIEDAIARLIACKADEIKFSKLASIEQMIASDLIAENRHLNCAGCLRWLNALIDKMES